MLNVAPFILSFLTTICLNAQQVQFGGISYLDALNITTKQMMLSQRMSKAIVVGELGGQGSNVNQELRASKTLFDRNLAILKVNVRNQNIEVKTKLKEVTDQWKKFKKVIDVPMEDLNFFLNETEMLFDSCLQLMIATKKTAMEKGADFAHYRGFQPRIRAIVKVGKIRMLSQKMCLNYAACRLSKTKKVKGKGGCNKYRFQLNQLDKLVNELLMFKINNSKTDEYLSGVLYALQKIESNKIKFVENKIPLLKVINITNSLLVDSSKLAKAFSTPPRKR